MIRQLDVISPGALPRPGPKEPIGNLLIDRFSVAYRKDTEELFLRVDFINDPEASGSVFPQPLQIPKKRLAGIRVQAQSSHGFFDAPFYIRREVADNFCYVRRDVRLKGGHYRFRTFGG